MLRSYDVRNEIVGYVRADLSKVAAELLEEFTLADGRCSVRLRLLETGVIKRLSGSDLERVHRDWQEPDHEDGKGRADGSSLAGASETETHARVLLEQGVITDVEFARIVGKDRAFRSAAAEDGKAPAWAKAKGGASASCAGSSVSPQTQSGSGLSKRLEFGSPAEAVLDKAKMLHAKGVPGSDVVAFCEMTAQRVGCEWSSVKDAVLRILASPSSPASDMSRVAAESALVGAVAEARAQREFDVLAHVGPADSASQISALSGGGVSKDQHALWRTGLSGPPARERPGERSQASDESFRASRVQTGIEFAGGALGWGDVPSSAEWLGLTREEAREELKTAQITFDSEQSRKPLDLHVAPGDFAQGFP